MGGYGSSSWRSASRRLTVDESLTLDIAHLQTEGLLSSGRVETIQWLMGKKDKASISFIVDSGYLILDYLVSQPGSTQHIRTQVHLVTTEAFFGGTRYWVTCPLDDTGRRLAKLYLPPGALQFGCRECHHLTYARCQDSGWYYGYNKWTPYKNKEEHVDYFRGISVEVS